MASYLIDITRLISRIGKGKPTGIDRVELAYLQEITARDPDALAIAKLGKDYLIVAAKHVATAIDKINSNTNFGRLGVHDAFRFKLPVEQRRVRQFLRKHARASSRNLDVLFADLVLPSLHYYNVGHSNLSESFLSALAKTGCASISVMVHDMIPLDHPEFTREGITQQFRTRMYAVSKYATRVICNSEHTKSRVQYYFEEWGRCPEILVARLGVERIGKPSSADLNPPYFVCLGTIEPRKNHALLFEVWERLKAENLNEPLPVLHIVGQRGWKNESVFEQLDKSSLMGKNIFEHTGLSDEELGDLISQSAGLLFPSFVEGYGLPALEAAQLGVPVICSDLPVFREILEDFGIFVPSFLTFHK